LKHAVIKIAKMYEYETKKYLKSKVPKHCLIVKIILLFF